jgi:hypothetical protein
MPGRNHQLRGSQGFFALGGPDVLEVSGGWDGTVRVWFVGKDDADLVAPACVALPRDLSLEAIKRFNIDPDASWPCAERAKTLWPHSVGTEVAPAAGPAKARGAAAAQ